MVIAAFTMVVSLNERLLDAQKSRAPTHVELGRLSVIEPFASSPYVT